MLRWLQGLCVGVFLCGSSVLAAEACRQSPARMHELRVLDEAQITDLVDQQNLRQVPPRLMEMLRELTQAAASLRDGPALHLLAYESAELNAYAADHGLVILTSALWSAEAALSDDELAAVIAHELAHIERRDALAEACAALEGLGDADLSIEAARERMAWEQFNPSSPLGQAARALLHAQEHAADLRAIELLRLTGRDPLAMASALQRLHGGKPAALNLFVGSSHPALDARLARARAAAQPSAIPTPP